ncbi:nicotinate-nucleotide pyrophosphorylase [Methanolobus bombayensis]|uniref:nicotinate-nucleotide pyrophosphorylase n=1 Tax=Methanolobus bombayensis TaxID=38023 RepID=UPI001AEB668A|nr:nicotinate-nucleotide pyrophosphorylase [Methanolobus bombayensis]MBP1910526.1 nicotinate-nucleotide pyrophosphorylase (carboxylating)/molybdenum transport protein [Methanolobus bombayensis]
MIDFFDLYLAEDCPYGDETTEFLEIGGNGRIRIKSREHGVAACMDDLAAFYRKNGLEVVNMVPDGNEFNPNDVIFEAQGDLPTIFKLWRISQTFLSMVCAIASKTRFAVELARKSNPDIMVATSRKTHPGFRKYELKAVKIGGGDHHRNSLSDSILVTQNHLDVMEKQVNLRAMRKIEIEPRTREEALEAAPVADILLLDHYSPEELETFVPELRALNAHLEIAVGGIDLQMVSDYAKHVDFIVTTAPYYAKPLDLTSKIRRM